MNRYRAETLLDTQVLASGGLPTTYRMLRDCDRGTGSTDLLR